MKVQVLEALRELKRRRDAVSEKPLSFREFVNLVRPRYVWYRHCEILADVLQQVADGKIKRLMVFMPPRAGKSELASRLFPAYFLYRHPDKWAAIASYGANLAYTLSRSARENYTRSGGPLSDKASAVQHWETGKGGGLWACGVGGPATGKGWHLGIIDDPIKNSEEAASETIREKQKEWLASTWLTREEPWDDKDTTGAQVIIQTRWHEDDLSGHVLAQEREACDPDSDDEPERWHIVSMAAIKEDWQPSFPPSCTVEPDWRETGEALCPERRPLSVLQKLKSRLGAYTWGALFQQNPTAKEGLFFKVSQLQIIDATPVGLTTLRKWDVASTASGGDYTAGLKLGKDSTGNWFVLDVIRGQWATEERNRIMLQTAALDGRTTKILVPQDPGSAGVDSAKAFVRMFAGYGVTVERETGDKITRADPVSAQVNAGNVYLVKGAWNSAFIEELRQFPQGKHDDQVDALSGAFNALDKQSAFEWEFS